MDKRILVVLIILVGLVVSIPLFAALKKRLIVTSTGGETDIASVPAHGGVLEGQTANDPVQGVMTQEHFSRIRPGMSYAECVEIIGSEGAAMSPEQLAGERVQEGYTWLDHTGKTEYALGFMNGRLAGKSFGASRPVLDKMDKVVAAQQANTTTIGSAQVQQLERQAQGSGRPVSITLEEFDAISRGITYDECVAIIGTNNEMAEQYSEARERALADKGGGNSTLRESYTWVNSGGYYAEIMFQNGRVTDKVWKKGPSGGGGSVRGSGGGPPTR